MSENPGDYWPAGERFGVMCVQGYTDRAGDSDADKRWNVKHGFDFYVVDLNREGEVLRKFTGRGKWLEERKVQMARTKACLAADNLNFLETVAA